MLVLRCMRSPSKDQQTCNWQEYLILENKMRSNVLRSHIQHNSKMVTQNEIPRHLLHTAKGIQRMKSHSI